MERFALALALVLALVLPSGGAWAGQVGPGVASVAATLSILHGSVRRVPVGGSSPEPASDGMDLGVGDRVLTGPDARALVTFLDGTTITVEPESDVAVAAAVVGRGAPSSITIQVNVGTVWGRVGSLVDGEPTVTLESSTAAATVHDGLFGGQQNPDGSFVCWTTDGEMAVQGTHGEPGLVLEPGQATTVQPGGEPTPRPFAVNQSALRISVAGGALPLLLMPDGARLAGFVAPGIEVNQVFGSFTGVADGARIIEVPAGAAGPFALVFEGVQDGGLQLVVTGLFRGIPVYEHRLSAEIGKGERVGTEITQVLEASSAGDPRTARVEGGSLGPVRRLDGPLPGTVVLSPSEVRAVGGG